MILALRSHRQGCCPTSLSLPALEIEAGELLQLDNIQAGFDAHEEAQRSFYNSKTAGHETSAVIARYNVIFSPALLANPRLTLTDSTG